MINSSLPLFHDVCLAHGVIFSSLQAVVGEGEVRDLGYNSHIKRLAVV